MTDIKKYDETVLTVLATTQNAPLTYERLEAIIKNTAVNETMAVQLTTQLKRMAVAIGALSGRAFGVNDFCYRFDRRHENNQRKLHMWVHTERQGQYPSSELVIELTPSGYVYRTTELQIKHAHPQNTAGLQ